MVTKQGSGVATIPPSADHRNGDWISTDIYQGEMYLDTDELVDNKFLPDTSSDVYYTNSYFSIISETNFYTTFDHYEKGRFLTEKIFKYVYYKRYFGCL
jgi:hypothetical protein